MLIGKPGAPTTAISSASADRIEVRGHDLCRELMGHLTFTEYFFLLVSGRKPSEQQAFFLDLLLVTIAEHSLVPSVQAARMTYRADPDALQGAVAAGILGCGSVILGTAEICSRALLAAQERIAAGKQPADAARETLRAIRANGGKAPGFGHPLHNPVDPRTVRIFELADAHGVAGRHVAMAREMEAALPDVWGRAMPMNASMAIAAVLLDLDFPIAIIKGIPILGRTAGLLAHLAEEKDNPIGFLLASRAEDAISYAPQP